MVSLEHLSFEVTRRCNESCAMCMRGNPEDVDMSEDIVNKVLLDNYIKDIEAILFTGGEPTLNEKLICYVIDLLIKNNIPVNRLAMVTNAKKYPKDILEAFNDYKKYCKTRHLANEVLINFSVDEFHEKNPNVINEYKEKYPQFYYVTKGLDHTWKTGRSEQGDFFEYKVLPMYVQILMGYIWVRSDLYVTAKGNYETMGDGMYSDMDRIYIGSVSDYSLLDILDRYGEITYGTKEEFKKLLTIARNT